MFNKSIDRNDRQPTWYELLWLLILEYKLWYHTLTVTCWIVDPMTLPFWLSAHATSSGGQYSHHTTFYAGNSKARRPNDLWQIIYSRTCKLAACWHLTGQTNWQEQHLMPSNLRDWQGTVKQDQFQPKRNKHFIIQVVDATTITISCNIS